MKKIFLLFVFVFALSTSSRAQAWVCAHLPVHPAQIRAICEDTINHKIYVAGLIDLAGGGDASHNSIWMYDGISWSKIDTIGDVILTMAIYNSNLVIGGFFRTIDRLAMPYIAQWDGSHWQGLGGNMDTVARISRVKVINGELYAMGQFDKIGGITAHSIAKWNGTNWSNVFNFPPMVSTTSVSDVAYYKGLCYVGGSFVSTNNSIQDLMVFDGSNWKQVGTSDSIRGSYSSVWELEVYKGELYACGSILKSEGNVGNCIQRWNGTSWKAAGTGVQDEFDSYISWNSIEDVVIHNNYMYLGGTFSYAGDVPGHGVTRWDGNQYCGLGVHMNSNGGPAINTIGFFGDTLFAAVGDTINHTYMGGLARYFNGNSTDTCSLPISFPETKTPAPGLHIFPNPGTDQLFLDIFPDEKGPFEISLFSVSGKLVGETLISDTLESTPLNIEFLSAGMYFVLVETSNRQYRAKFVKN
jgi:hypothetical protein